MSFNTLELKQEYRSFRDDVVRDFYIPILKESVSYKRAVGFFSSAALSEISNGLHYFIKNGGNIQLVASPKLYEEDIEAIKKGYELRKILHSALIRELSEPQNIYESKRLNLLANLIADEILDIKIAFIEKGSSMGMYHEKMGLFSDTQGNTIAFSGSMNESENALLQNYEAIDVWYSWKSQEQYDKVAVKTSAFSSIWNNEEPNIRIIEFPEIKQEILERYKKEKISDYTKAGDKIKDGETALLKKQLDTKTIVAQLF
jgi:hypothetical protein